MIRYQRSSSAAGLWSMEHRSFLMEHAHSNALAEGLSRFWRPNKSLATSTRRHYTDTPDDQMKMSHAMPTWAMMTLIFPSPHGETLVSRNEKSLDVVQIRMFFDVFHKCLTMSETVR